MEKIKLMSRIKEIYSQNKNIIKYLKKIDGRKANQIEDILISYDIQSGSYINVYKNNPDNKNSYCKCLSQIIEGLCHYDSILEVGIGEATTMGPLHNYLSKKPDYYGLDISWSRLKYARKFLRELEIDDVELFVADLFCIPMKDNSVDIVYTSHSIEPNEGREKEALEELYRITNKYLVLLEPSYELANDEARQRMKEHGYVTGLYSAAKELGYDIVEHRLFEISANPLNPTGILVIKKESKQDLVKGTPLCCPITKTDMVKKDNVYFSEESGVAYPILEGIPFLMPEKALLATKLLEE